MDEKTCETLLLFQKLPEIRHFSGNQPGIEPNLRNVLGFLHIKYILKHFSTIPFGIIPGIIVQKSIFISHIGYFSVQESQKKREPAPRFSVDVCFA